MEKYTSKAAPSPVNTELLATYIILTVGFVISSLGVLKTTPCASYSVSLFRTDVCMDFALGVLLVILGVSMCYSVGRGNEVIMSHWGQIGARSCLYLCLITSFYLWFSITKFELINTIEGYVIVAAERTIVNWLSRVVLGVAAIDWIYVFYLGVKFAVRNEPYV